VRAGATHVNTTVNGLGERAGNAPLEEVVMALRHLHGIDTGVDMYFYMTVEYGGQCFRAECGGEQKYRRLGGVHSRSGHHVDGLLKNPLNYQPFDPAESAWRIAWCWESIPVPAR